MTSAQLASAGTRLAAVGIAGVMLAGCGEKLSWNQKLVMKVETPDGVVSGGSVIRVDLRYEPRLIAHQGGIVKKVTGESAFVEVRPGAYLFALLGDEADRARHTFFPVDAPDGAWDAYAALSRLREARSLPRESYPRFVTFTNPSDPRTISSVDPENLAAVFGPGYHLKSVLLEITDDPVGRDNVSRVLNWWNTLEVPIGGGIHRKYGDPLYGIGKWDFVREQ
ncbi:MAG: hypothetical protein WAU86_14135 [Oricola sp.]